MGGRIRFQGCGGSFGVDIRIVGDFFLDQLKLFLGRGTHDLFGSPLDSFLRFLSQFVRIRFENVLDIISQTLCNVAHGNGCFGLVVEVLSEERE